MDISRKDLHRVTAEGIISEEQADRLWQALSAQHSEKPQFDFSHLAYYFGALIIVSAMGWFLTEAWDSFGGGGIFLIALAYAIGFTFVGHRLWRKPMLKTPGGLFITLAVCMMPLLIYGFEQYMYLCPQDGSDEYFGYFLPRIYRQNAWSVATFSSGSLGKVGGGS